MPIKRVNVRSVYTIQPFGPAKIKQETEKVTRLLSVGRLKPTWRKQGQPIFEVNDGNDAKYVVMTIDGEIAYFVRHLPVKDFPFGAGRQIMAIRLNKLHPAVVGLARHIMFQLLLPRYGAILSDETQTTEGNSFWINAMVVALQRRLCVYFVDGREDEHHPTFLRLHTKDDIAGVGKDLWGTTNDHMYTFAAVSIKPIPGNP